MTATFSPGCGDGGSDEGRDHFDGWRDHEAAGLRGLTSRQASLLANENRQAIVEQLDETPGLNVNLLAEETGIPRSVVSFHLRRLERADLVVEKEGQKGNQRLCFLTRDEHLWENPRTRILFGGEPTRNVALFVLRNAGASTDEVAKALDCSPRAARRHLRLLEKNGLVERQRVGRVKEAHPRRSLAEWREKVGEGFGGPAGEP